MYSSRVMANCSELLRFRIVGVVRIENGLGGPYSDVSVYCGSVSVIV